MKTMTRTLLCSAEESKLYRFGMTWEWVNDKFYFELLYLALKKSNEKAILANFKKDFILYSTLRTHLRLNQTHIKHTCQISPLRPETFRPIIWITKQKFCTKQASYLYIKHNSKSNIKHQVTVYINGHPVSTTLSLFTMKRTVHIV